MIVGYVAASTALQGWFYTRSSLKETAVERARACAVWRTNKDPRASRFVIDTPGDSQVWWLPAAMRRFEGKRRVAEHAVYASINLAVSGAMAGLTSYLVAVGATQMESGVPVGPAGWARVLGWGVVALLWELTCEYFWHRVMHAPLLYRHFHSIHHKARNPTAFDDLLIHPVEALGFYLILFAPPLLFPIHAAAFAVYFALHGVSGILDHSGVEVSVGSGLYSSVDHELHHLLTNVNFATPFMMWDKIMGTYVSPHDPRAQGLYPSSPANTARPSKVD